MIFYAENMKLPRYFIVGDRPVKFVATAAGGMDVLAWDWEFRKFTRHMEYLTSCSHGTPEVDEVEETQFLLHLGKIVNNEISTDAVK